MQAPLAVTGWLWTTTTVLGAVAALTLLGILSADVLVAATSPDDGRHVRGPLRGRLGRLAIPLAAFFVAVVIVRFALILANHHGP